MGFCVTVLDETLGAEKENPHPRYIFIRFQVESIHPMQHAAKRLVDLLKRWLYTMGSVSVSAANR